MQADMASGGRPVCLHWTCPERGNKLGWVNIQQQVPEIVKCKYWTCPFSIRKDQCTFLGYPPLFVLVCLWRRTCEKYPKLYDHVAMKLVFQGGSASDRTRPDPFSGVFV